MVDDPEGLRSLDVPGISLLLEVLELSRSEPHITSGAILERFRGSEHEAALWKLATWDHMVPEQGLEAEFRGALERLLALRNEQRLQYLHDRFTQGELTPDEREEYRTLLAKNHRG
jgi:DNA primase